MSYKDVKLSSPGLLVPLLPPKHNATAKRLLKGLAVHFTFFFPDTHSQIFSRTHIHTVRWQSLRASSMCHTDLAINQTEKRQRERRKRKEAGNGAKCEAPGSLRSLGRTRHRRSGALEENAGSYTRQILRLELQQGKDRPMCVRVCSVCV